MTPIDGTEATVQRHLADTLPAPATTPDYTANVLRAVQRAAMEASLASVGVHLDSRVRSYLCAVASGLWWLVADAAAGKVVITADTLAVRTATEHLPLVSACGRVVDAITGIRDAITVRDTAGGAT